MPFAEEILIRGGSVLFDGALIRADILVRGSKVAAIGPDLPVPEGAQIIDAASLVVSAAFAEIHAHLREPGQPEKETIRTGTLAAARGGYSIVCAMPNLDPVPDCPENLAVQQAIIDRDAVVPVRPYASITRGRRGKELVDLRELNLDCVAFSDDGSGVQDETLMATAMRRAARIDAIIAAHCEDNSLLNGGYIHDGRYCAEHSHKGICSESEWGPIKRDLALCEQYGCHYHVCHISTAESVALIRDAKARGVRVTCETAPHYLTLCDDDLQEDGRFKMNPPLRSAADRDAILEGLLDGTIDCIATDHAPHTAEQKSKGLAGSAMGVVGLETSFPVLYTKLVRTGILPLERLLALMSDAPRRIFSLGGPLRVGGTADLVLIDLEDSYRIDPDTFFSKGHSTPFAGMEVYGRIRMTLAGGRIVYDYNQVS
ncbi:MAG: dihydroorotase [Bacteroidales bacterium]|nr:dihydroorotase [Bacteroidales bacterium]